MSSIYEQPFEEALQKYMDEGQEKYSKMPPELDTSDGAALKQAVEIASAKMDTLAPPTPFTFDFNAITEAEVQDDEDTYQRIRKAADLTYQSGVEELQSAYKSQVQAAQDAADASVSGLSKSYDELLTYKDVVKDATLRYDIKPSDLALDEAALTRQDMEALVATSLSTCKRLKGGNKIRDKLRFIWEMPQGQDSDSRAFWAIGLTIAFVLLSPILFFGIVGYLGKELWNVNKNMEGLRIADKLMYGINFQRFRDDPHIEDIPQVDTSALEQQRDATYAEAEQFNPDAKRDALKRDLLMDMDRYQTEIDKVNEAVSKMYKMQFLAWSDYQATAEEAFREFRENRKTFADTQNQSLVLKYDATVSLEDEVIEGTMMYLSSNIVFANRDPLMLNFQRLLLANMLLNVQPTTLTVTIYDPERLGQDFATFLDDVCKDYVKVETKELPKVIDEHREYAKDSFRILDTKTIEEYNADAESKGMVTREYKLLFISTPDEGLYKNEAFLTLMRTSVRAGVHVWMVGNQPVEGCQFFSEPFYLVDHPYPVDQALISRCMNTYLTGIKNRKDKGIAYVSSFQEKYLPEEKWWTENCDSGVKVNLGLQDGDPSKGFDIVIGDMPVHALAGGATGAGKSAFLNQMLASLILRYPPSALELILVDFKNVEFVQLKDKATNYSRIPHAKILAGTKDGEYAKSIFEYLIKDMEHRNEEFQKVGAKKLESYNQWMRGSGHPEKCFPRTLIIIDEFQVMFSLDQKIVGDIQELIKQLSKLGRSAGVHMFFTSQSMQGTMPKDVKDQFSLRVALRCSSDVSEELLGSPIASTIKHKFGYLYSNTNAGATQDTTHLWRTPFLDEHVLYDEDKLAKKISEGKMPEGSETILTKVGRMCAERGEVDRHAYFYDSKEVWPAERLQYWFDTYPEVFKENPGSVLLGERTSFSTKTLPSNFRFTRADNEHLLMYAGTDIDLCNLINTVYTNLKHDPNNIVFINSADIDYVRVLDLQSKVEAKFAPLVMPAPTPDAWFANLEGIVRKRKQEGMEGKKPVYFFAVRWDKQGELYRGENYQNSDRFKALLQDAPTVDVHIILCVSSIDGFRAGHYSLFNHKIVGQGSQEVGYRMADYGHIDTLYESDEAPCALYCFGPDRTKFKIYSFEYKEQFQSREIDV